MPRKTEERIQQLKQLAASWAGDTPADVEFLRKALHDRSNLVLAEAAKIIGEVREVDLIPDLLSAFDCLFQNPAKADPKCWGKTAIVKALTVLDYEAAEPFIRGSRHVQMEPVWGGQEDAATHLRANAVLALVQCTDLTRPEILRHLVDALADSSDVVRIEAVRALEQMNGEESSVLLRLKAHTGDLRAPVIGQVFDSLLQLDGERAVEFVTRFLKSADPEIRDEAALALGSSRLAGAVAILIEAWENSRSREFASVLLRALGSSREETALDFLLKLVRQGSGRDAASALEALEFHRDSPEILARIEQAKQERSTELSTD